MDELYRDQILEHYKRPPNFGALDSPDLEFEDTNPFCGDEQHVMIRLDEDDRVYIGTWTRLVVRRATPEEQAGAAS